MSLSFSGLQKSLKATSRFKNLMKKNKQSSKNIFNFLKKTCGFL
jgi:hypothetical protein